MAKEKIKDILSYHIPDVPKGKRNTLAMRLGGYVKQEKKDMLKKIITDNTDEFFETVDADGVFESVVKEIES